MRLSQGVEEGRKRGRQRVGRVWRVLARAFGRYYFVAAVWKPIWLAAVCTQKLLDAITYFHYVWLAVLDLTVICALVIVEAGVAALGGVAVVFLIQPLIVWMAKRVAALRPKALKFTDARVRLLGEVLSGMRVVKVNGWTAAFLDRIRALRDNELQWLRRAAYVRSVNSTLKVGLVWPGLV
ncbi:unnamed protein product, partial [Closterium sp. NIES-53]